MKIKSRIIHPLPGKNLNIKLLWLFFFYFPNQNISKLMVYK